MEINRRAAVGIGMGFLTLFTLLNIESAISDEYLVAIPYDSPPADADMTNLTDPQLRDIDTIQTVVRDAIGTDEDVTASLDVIDQWKVADAIQALPRYEGDSTYRPGPYVTYRSEAAVLYIFQEQ